MEVASPLAFDPRSTGSKRPLGACSPGFVDTAGHGTFAMDLAAENNTGHRAFKRRRFDVDSSMHDADSAATKPSPFLTFPSQSLAAFSPSQAQNMKRCREEASSPSQQDLRPVVEAQATEISSLKTERSTMATALNSLKSEHDKVVKENKLLKKAVSIQQERQAQSSNELEEARKFRVNAEDQIRRLEHMVLSLRYHLQAQQTNQPGNDFMGFPPRPPDVY